MRVLLQRVEKVSISVEESVISSSKFGLLLYVGFKFNDTIKEIEYMVDKVLNLRIFEDDQGKMNRSVKDIKGDISIVSQFTLYGDTKKGRRPGFSDSMKPKNAFLLYNKFIELAKISELNITTGEFGEYMKIESVNSGPATFMIEI